MAEEPKAWALVHDYGDGSGRALVVRIYLDAARANQDAALHTGDALPSKEQYRASSAGEWHLHEAPMVGDPPAPRRYTLAEIDRMRAALKTRLSMRAPLRDHSPYSFHSPTRAEVEDELRTLLAAGIDPLDVEVAAAADQKEWDDMMRLQRQEAQRINAARNPPGDHD